MISSYILSWFIGLLCRSSSGGGVPEFCFRVAGNCFLRYDRWLFWKEGRLCSVILYVSLCPHPALWMFVYLCRSSSGGWRVIVCFDMLVGFSLERGRAFSGTSHEFYMLQMISSSILSWSIIFHYLIFYNRILYTARPPFFPGINASKCRLINIFCPNGWVYNFSQGRTWLCLISEAFKTSIDYFKIIRYEQINGLHLNCPHFKCIFVS